MIDELLSFLIPAYEELGNELNIKPIEQKSLIDFHPTPQMKIAFNERVKENADFLFQPNDQWQYQETFNYDFGFGKVDPCHVVNLKDILPAWRKRLLSNNQLREENFEIEELNHSNTGVIYKDIKAEKIIFCDGINSSQNSFFKNLPFALNKGEVIFIESPEIPSTDLVPYPACSRLLFARWCP